MYSCEHCDYKSTRRYNLNVHVKNKHGPYQRAPTTMSVDPVQDEGLIAPQPSGNTLY